MSALNPIMAKATAWAAHLPDRTLSSVVTHAVVALGLTAMGATGQSFAHIPELDDDRADARHYLLTDPLSGDQRLYRSPEGVERCRAVDGSMALLGYGSVTAMAASLAEPGRHTSVAVDLGPVEVARRLRRAAAAKMRNGGIRIREGEDNSPVAAVRRRLAERMKAEPGVVLEVPDRPGVGKTTATLRQAAEWVADGGRVYWLVTDVTQQMQEAVAALTDAGLDAKPWRGVTADGMCSAPERAKTAFGAHFGLKEACAGCPFADECVYRQQDDADVLVAHQAMLATGGLPNDDDRPVLVVVDEAYAYGFRAPVILSPAQLETVEAGYVHAGEPLNDLHALIGPLLRFASDRKSGGVPVGDLVDALVAAEVADEAKIDAAIQRLQWLRKFDMADPLVLAMARAAWELMEVLRAVRDALGRPTDEVMGNLVVDDGKLVLRRYVAAHEMFEENAAGLSAVLALNGTPQPSAVFEAAFPKHEVRRLDTQKVADAPGQTRIAVLGLNSGKRAMQESAAARRRVIETVVAISIQHFGQRVIVFTTKAIIEALAGVALPSNIELIQYERGRARNDLQDASVYVALGINTPVRDVIAAQVGAMTGIMPPPCPSLPGYEHAAEEKIDDLYMHDGRTFRTTRPFYSDELMEAVRWQAQEATVIQALERGRPVCRETPAIYYDISGVPDTDAMWDDVIHVNELAPTGGGRDGPGSAGPGVYGYLWAEGHLPLSETAACGVFGLKRDAARSLISGARGLLGSPKESYRHPQQTSVRRFLCQQAGTGRKPFEVIARPDMDPAALRAIYEAKLGPLKTFAEIEPAPVPVETPEFRPVVEIEPAAPPPPEPVEVREFRPEPATAPDAAEDSPVPVLRLVASGSPPAKPEARPSLPPGRCPSEYGRRPDQGAPSSSGMGAARRTPTRRNRPSVPSRAVRGGIRGSPVQVHQIVRGRRIAERLPAARWSAVQG